MTDGVSLAKRREAVTLRWGDEDRYGHVNNVEFFRLLEEARARWFLDPDGPTTLLGHGLVVARAELRYLRPLNYRTAPIWAHMSVTALTPVSFTLSYRIHDLESDDSECYAVGEVELVGYDLDAERPRRLTPEEKAWLSGSR